MAVLEYREVTKLYGGVAALDGVDLTIEPGRIVGLLGPNGCGKSTFLKLACGLLAPTAGEIEVCGGRPGQPAAHAQVSFLPERMAVPVWMTAEQLVDFYQDFYGDFRRDVALQMLADLHIDPALRVREMSKGTREKVQLILAMSRAALLYLLDEPIGGVDPATRDYILSTIIANYNPEASVIVSTHLIADVEKLLDEVVFLKNGQVILHDEVDHLRESRGMSVDALFREVFKC